VGTTVDGTEQKRIEAALRRGEGYLAEGQRLTHMGSWSLNIAPGRFFTRLQNIVVCLTSALLAANQLVRTLEFHYVSGLPLVHRAGVRPGHPIGR
jgi:hypothetical protein